MTLVLHAGALVALERRNRMVDATVKRQILAGDPPVTHGGVVGQVWRGGAGRQANLAKVLRALRIVPLDDALGRQAGVLLGISRTSDVIDAAVVLLGKDGDELLTSDPDDLRRLVDATALELAIVPV